MKLLLLKGLITKVLEYKGDFTRRNKIVCIAMLSLMMSRAERYWYFICGMVFLLQYCGVTINCGMSK